MTEKKDALVKPEQAVVQAVGPENLTFDILRKYICPNATEQEMFLFQQICVSQKLDPFKREVYFIKYNAGEKAQIVVGYEVYLKRANSINILDGWETSVDHDEGGRPIKANIIIYRKDWSHPFRHSILYSEYVQRRGDGQITKMWANKTETMMIKTVISQGFRLCFPVELGGMPYTADEMPAGGEGDLPTAPIVIETKKIEDAKPKDTVEYSPKESLDGDTPEYSEGKGDFPDPSDTAKTADDPMAHRVTDGGPRTIAKKIEVPKKPEKPKPVTPPVKSESAATIKAASITLDEMKKGIIQMIDALEKSYGRKRVELVGKIHKRLVERFSITDINIPDQLTQEQATFVCDLLVLTLEAEEKKKEAPKEEVPF